MNKVMTNGGYEITDDGGKNGSQCEGKQCLRNNQEPAREDD
jgi:hypothetical protein